LSGFRLPGARFLSSNDLLLNHLELMTYVPVSLPPETGAVMSLAVITQILDVA
jgi:hypothetical protein